MANLAAVRDAVAAVLKAGVTVPDGIEVYARMRQQPQMPCLMVTGLDEVEYHVTSMGGDSRWRLMILGIAPGGLGDENSQRAIDHWLSDEAGGVMRVLEDNPSLTLGVDPDDVSYAQDLIVRSSDGYAFYVIGGVERLGVAWEVDVYT